MVNVINAVFTWKIGRYLPACYKIGADCTCFECATSGTGMKVTVYRETDDKRQVTSTEIDDDLILLLKYFGLGSGRGDIAPACFIIAHNGMPKRNFIIGQ